VLWFRGRVVRPLFALAETVQRFGEGDRSARAEARGPRARPDELALQRDGRLARDATRVAARVPRRAHDLRGPLGTLRVAVDLASPDHPLPPEPQLRHLLAIADRQITQLDRMARDFLAISQIEAGKLELEVANHDLRAIAASAIELLDEKQRVTLELSSEPVIVPCDDTRVGQAITNLLSNALKYSPPTAPVQVVVVDRGVGIPVEDQRMIFEPFRRRRATNRVPGTGLGLFNVKHLVEAHGGRVELESPPSRGSIFRVHLPLRHTS
jgi:signal transduction histidine kinase